ncbi:EF-P 5-aminopentanol modification-associated protein YfmH [Jeotgalibacillus haloalkalitolerans]|uniref:Pitrilysin family protein n=1 Tax=Jeotgalibacillus haloalkalitolerans TaxID=3104292 RepID=A0ABU5KKJ3_9BACL|nr:pitrilysin family protein [Jeotgalibacillus sp. HH7-29]MDZ5711784.1 pitrilysin family protein [Jeotgalibacillus sp. HH7-29]
MRKKVFSQLEEEIYMETMDNGLQVCILPKKDFNKTFATFTTKYGSIDNRFIPLGEDDFTQVPDGVAHFLEHKMFEKEDGDVFQKFSMNGASANAFTSFTRTAYLFSSTSNFSENLDVLIDFVQAPYFTEETVEKEKGIIGQEITMYDDNADWRLYFGAIENMFKNHPVKVDIAGTVESISSITKDHLYECYHTFYHPSNMMLFIVGSVEPEDVMNHIRQNQQEKHFEPEEKIARKFEDEPEEVNRAHHELHMDVQVAKCMVGIKSAEKDISGLQLMKKELAVNTALDVLFGKTSDHYTSLYDQGLIDDHFSYDFTQENNFGFALIGSNTSNPEKLSERIKQIILKEVQSPSITEDQLQSVKKKNIGGFLRSLNSPEFIANQFTRYAFNGMDLFEAVPVLETITLEDVHEAFSSLVKEDRMTSFYILPKVNG